LGIVVLKVWIADNWPVAGLPEAEGRGEGLSQLLQPPLAARCPIAFPRHAFGTSDALLVQLMPYLESGAGVSYSNSRHGAKAAKSIYIFQAAVQ
jgi:hypothetical protein